MRRALFIACGAGLAAWALAALQELPGANIPRHVALTMAAWVCYVVALGLILRMPARGQRLDLAFIFGVALLVRATFLFTSPSLSDDVYRSVWDARLMHAGVNPYSYAPSAPELAAYRDPDIWARVNHKDQRTPYPPLAEILGATAYWLLPERLLAMQALAAAMDLLSAGLLAWLLHRWGADPRRSLAVAWSPVGALHFAHSGHNDAGMIAAMVGAALALSFGRRWLALVALGAATCVKGVPALMVPAFARAGGPWPVLGWAATCALVAAPFLGAGSGLVAGALSEIDQRFNDSLHLLVERAARVITPEHAGPIAGVFSWATVAAAAGAAWRMGDGTPSGALVGGCRVLAVYLLMAPVVAPWYLTWLAPLIAFQAQPGNGRMPFRLNDVPAWLWLGGTATLTELTYLEGGSGLWIPIRLIEYGPTYALLALAVAGWCRNAVGKRQGASAA